jgi:20S proteasome subunit beta 4
MCKLPFAAQGHASYFVLSTMDRYWEKDMSVEQVMKLLKKCLEELKVRYIANLPQWTVKIVDKDGIRDMEL